MGDVQDGASEQLEPESSMIFGASESAEDLQALPKVSHGQNARCTPTCSRQHCFSVWTSVCVLTHMGGRTRTGPSRS